MMQPTVAFSALGYHLHPLWLPYTLPPARPPLRLLLLRPGPGSRRQQAPSSARLAENTGTRHAVWGGPEDHPDLNLFVYFVSSTDAQNGIGVTVLLPGPPGLPHQSEHLA